MFISSSSLEGVDALSGEDIPESLVLLEGFTSFSSSEVLVSIDIECLLPAKGLSVASSSFASRSLLRLTLRSISVSESESESRMLLFILIAFETEFRAVSPALWKKELIGG